MTNFSNKFIHFFQPIVSIDTGEINHYEVLLRPNDSLKHSSFLVFNYIESIEKTGVIIDLDKWNIESISKKIEDDGFGVKYPYAINLSAKTIQDPSFYEYLNRVLSSMKHPNLLQFEITESSPINNFDLINKTADLIRSYGSEIAIDDFGSGYAGKEYLDRLDVDIVKIDGSHIRDILRNKDSRDFVAETVKEARKKGIKVVAEYVEDSAIQSILRKAGVNYGQGYLYSKAMEIPPTQKTIKDNIISSLELMSQSSIQNNNISLSN